MGAPRSLTDEDQLDADLQSEAVEGFRSRCVGEIERLQKLAHADTEHQAQIIRNVYQNAIHAIRRIQ